MVPLSKSGGQQLPRGFESHPLRQGVIWNEGEKMNKGEITTNIIFKKVATILASYGAKKISIFGSYAREEANPESDMDIIVEFSEGKTLLDIVGIEQELSEALGIKVDLLTEKSISPYLVDRIKKEMVVIYE